MCWVGFVGGKMLKIHWFIDTKGKTVSVNGEYYLKMLKEVLWPQIRYSYVRDSGFNKMVLDLIHAEQFWIFCEKSFMEEFFQN